MILQTIFSFLSKESQSNTENSKNSPRTLTLEFSGSSNLKTKTKMKSKKIKNEKLSANFKKEFTEPSASTESYKNLPQPKAAETKPIPQSTPSKVQSEQKR